MAKCSFLRAHEIRALAQDNMLLWTEICGIQKAILEASSPCGPTGGALEVIVNDGTPMTWVSGVQSLQITNGGNNYFAVEATAEAIHPTGTGGELIPLVTGGTISGFTIVNGGSGYDPIPATVDMTGSGNGDADILVDPVAPDGIIRGFNILDTGTGYSVGDPLVIIRPTGSTGTNAQAEVATVNGAGGITSINLISGGSGYQTILATVEVTHPTGVGFLGVLQTNNGVVTGVSTQNGGNSYQPLYATATVVDNSGTGAILEINEDNVTGGVIQSITVVNGGFGYTQFATVDIEAAPTSSGSGATADVTITPDPNGYGPISPLYYDVFSGQSSDRMKTMQLEFIVDYFNTLGYNIRPQVNPQTGNTLQWWILW